ncbi:MAG: DUF6807 domain-containing protein [Thermoguttaceae bacterium]
MCASLVMLLLTIAGTPADETNLPTAKPVPAVQVLPLPYDQASFQYFGKELTRYHFGPTLRRPFNYPMRGPDDRSLTRMGHPRAPFGHSHHNSVWIGHRDVSGINFWTDRGDNLGRIVSQRIEQYEDGDESAWLLGLNAWQNEKAQTILLERRRIEVVPRKLDDWMMIVDLQLSVPSSKPVVLNQTAFGLIGVRMAKTIGVDDGGGRILNSAGKVNEKEAFHQPARWVDYSGPISPKHYGGITLMDHPANLRHPNAFHVRNDGWMGICLTLNKSLTIEPDKPLRLRYGLWNHARVPQSAEIEKQWQAFIHRPLAKMHKTP